MVTAIWRTHNSSRTGNQQVSKFKEESDMNTKIHISKWINISTPMKMVAGLVLGAMLMTAVALPSNASADAPKRPFTSEEQLVIMAEIDDRAYDSVSLTPEQQLVVKAEIDDGAYDSGFLTLEQQLLVKAEIDDGAYDPGFLTPEQQLLVKAEIDDGAYDTGFLTPEQQWMVQAEIDDDLV